MPYRPVELMNNTWYELQERMKALGYISANEKVEQTTLQALDESARLKPSDNVNQLHVKIVRCNSLKSRQVGKRTGHSPPTQITFCVKLLIIHHFTLVSSAGFSRSVFTLTLHSLPRIINY